MDNTTSLPNTLRHVPANIRSLVDPDDLVFGIKPDGACGIRSGAAHIFEDQEEAKRFRKVINLHITDRWSYYENKIPFPYSRQVGVQGKWKKFKTPDEYLTYICNNAESELLWTDTEEIHAIANLYQINIKIITIKGKDDPKPTIKKVGPNPELQEFSILPAGIVPDMTLLHSQDSHYDLIVGPSGVHAPAQRSGH